jgi:hypothetical protein
METYNVSVFTLPGPSIFSLNVHGFEKYTGQNIKARRWSEPLKSLSSILSKDAQSFAALKLGSNKYTSEHLNKVVIYD